MYWLLVVFTDPLPDGRTELYEHPDQFGTYSDCIQYFNDWRETESFDEMAGLLVGDKSGIEAIGQCYTSQELERAGYIREETQGLEYVGE